MSNTSITNLQISDTFQVWLNKTNEIIDLTNENVMLAGPGAGFTVDGNSTLVGSFTANTLVSDNADIDNLSILTLERSVDSNEQIISSSPIKIQTSVENLFDLQAPSGNRPILRMINGDNARWALGPQTNSSSSGFTIGLEGSTTPQLSITQGGRLTVNELQGNGSLVTNISASNITSGELDVDQIPDLNANNITEGVFNLSRIPDLPASKTTTGTFSVDRIPNLSATKITAGVLNVGRIPDLDANKIASGTLNVGRIPSTIVRGSRKLLAGNGIIIDGNGDLSTDRTISAVQLTSAQVANPNSTVAGVVTGQSLAQLGAIKGYIVFNGQTGATIKSKNLTLSKSSTGNYSITCSSSIRDNTSNWGVVITNIDDGTMSQTPVDVEWNVTQSINDFQNNWWNVFLSSRSTTGFEIRAKRTYSEFFTFNVGNDNAGGNAFGIEALDPSYIALIVF